MNIKKINRKICIARDAFEFSSCSMFASFLSKLINLTNYFSKDWINQYEGCKQHFTKFNTDDVVTFADQVTFTVEAIDSLTQDVRMDISKRMLKYLRQQKGQDETKHRGSDD